MSSPRLLLRTAAKAGLDAICIADHDTLEGYHRAVRVRRPTDPILIPSCESSTSKGHLLAIGVDMCWEKGTDPHEVLDDVMAEGGIVAAPHPFYLSTISVSWLARDLNLAIEAFNAMAAILIYPNLVAEKFAAKYGLPVTAGSDAHSHEMVGWGVTESDSDTVDGFLRDVAHRKVKIDGRRPPMGWAIRFASGSALGMVGSLFSGEEP